MTAVEHVELDTPFGRLRGARSEGVTAFRKVPYAEAPVGRLRFEMPSAAPRWAGVRDAIAAGPVPPQNPSRLDAVMGTYDVEQSEDCLHLDIWTGHVPEDRAPVLVFIHGGAFMTGGGSLPCYDGGILAKENGLVVVNITYRLGILGFFPHPSLGGLNLGLHDQVAALRWITQAISAFGGDPQRITVIGQSAGAFSIAAFAGTEAGAGLFNRAILMSAPVGIKLRTVEQSRPVANAILDVLGIAADDVDKLRTIPVDRALEGLRLLQRRPPAIPGDISPPFMPVLDDTLVQCDPIESIRTGGARWCDMMIGATREEYAAFSISNPSLDELSEDALEDLIRSHGEYDASATLARLRSARVPATPRMLLGDFYSERMFTRQSLEIAATQSGLGRKAFTYLFDWQAPVPGLGACHCIDLPFLFGNIDVWQAASMVKGADRREVRDLSRLFRGSIAAFAAAGDPNGHGLPEWPAYTANQTVLHFDRRIAASRYIA
ncbi:carboxylesterase/lipase family protein [Bradyrhizobium guangzhouense]|uniref:Carboxylic ester hydrolase n=1 Tax=Bradyrhizobium guangzhouense TaxID=1325095 RepID=A0AAE5X3F4_9BRAD|nr:carboxylesterase family protein [Bradyrhizobium guangzhouense]QAU47923.1 carboxylesterase/lipase family protein [Bradyrhizobium guangzhouense]RXH14481.1 carboxylesterase/lipase family protein [Bradyrhizobium guangzhouense]